MYYANAFLPASKRYTHILAPRLLADPYRIAALEFARKERNNSNLARSIVGTIIFFLDIYAQKYYTFVPLITRLEKIYGRGNSLILIGVILTTVTAFKYIFTITKKAAVNVPEEEFNCSDEKAARTRI